MFIIVHKYILTTSRISWAMFQRKKKWHFFVKRGGGFEPTTVTQYEFSNNFFSYKRLFRTPNVKDANTELAKHRLQRSSTWPCVSVWVSAKRGSLNWLQFVLHWFMRFSEFADFTEFPFYSGKTVVCSVTIHSNWTKNDTNCTKKYLKLKILWVWFTYL